MKIERIFTARDARLEKLRMDERLFAKKPRQSSKFIVVDKNGAAAINPVSAARANQYVAELDALCPSFAPHTVRPFA